MIQRGHATIRVRAHTASHFANHTHGQRTWNARTSDYMLLALESLSTRYHAAESKPRHIRPCARVVFRSHAFPNLVVTTELRRESRLSTCRWSCQALFSASVPPRSRHWSIVQYSTPVDVQPRIGLDSVVASADLDRTSRHTRLYSHNNHDQSQWGVIYATPKFL